MESPAMDTLWSDQNLPDYNPPNAKRAAIAVGVAPVLALVAFSLIIGDLIDVGVGFALFAACTAWVVMEMHQYQKNIDRYNDDYSSALPHLHDALQSHDNSPR
jgi:hypothetical protein